ncbi:MAG: hypothetical protein ACI89D_000088 [Bermanella sp.]|jgi:hypothetical protein
MKQILSSIALATLCQLGFASPDGVRDTAELMQSQQTRSTAQLLQLQRSGKLASRQEQHLPGSAQTKIYERYINSFGHTIPETYISEEFSE